MASGHYQFDKDNLTVTEAMQKDYGDNGYMVYKQFLDKEEIANILKVLENPDLIDKYGYGVPDGLGTKAKMVIWCHPGDDVTGMVARCEKVVNTCEQLMGGGEAYHYHAKFIRKDAFDGGCHLWHQDYGYWYQNGCLFPEEMITVFIAIDKCEKENGCLQILKGSHKCGRIEHKPQAGQTMADMERLNAIKEKCLLEHVELNPGDALFFHANLIHTSAPNTSPKRRWALLHSYNKKSNDPIYKHHHPNYTPLSKVKDISIKECTNYTDFSGKDFMDPKSDKTTAGEKEQK